MHKQDSSHASLFLVFSFSCLCYDLSKEKSCGTFRILIWIYFKVDVLVRRQTSGTCNSMRILTRFQFHIGVHMSYLGGISQAKVYYHRLIIDRITN